MTLFISLSSILIIDHIDGQKSLMANTTGTYQRKLCLKPESFKYICIRFTVMSDAHFAALPRLFAVTTQSVWAAGSMGKG